jgi:hypothetical protein
VSKRRTVGNSDRIEVYERTRGCCYYCGIGLRLTALHKPERDWLSLRGTGGLVMVIDHAYPIVRGGPDRLNNWVASCSACNLAKGWLSLFEYWLITALRRRNINFSFPGGPLEDPQRDWLCVYSDGQERELLLYNCPDAAHAYSRGKSIRKRLAIAARRVVATL